MITEYRKTPVQFGGRVRRGEYTTRIGARRDLARVAADWSDEDREEAFRLIDELFFEPQGDSMSTTEQSEETLGTIVSSTEEDQWPWDRSDPSPLTLIAAFELFRRKRKIGRVAAAKLLSRSSVLVDWDIPGKGKRPVVTGVEVRPFNGRKKSEMYTRNFFLGCLRHFVKGTPIPAQHLKPRKRKEEPAAQVDEVPVAVESPPVPDEAQSEAYRFDLVLAGVASEMTKLRSEFRAVHDAQSLKIEKLTEQNSLMSRGVWRVAKQLSRVLHEVKSRPLLHKEAREEIDEVSKRVDRELELTRDR